jgi:ceramide glucosyltransferase
VTIGELPWLLLLTAATLGCVFMLAATVVAPWFARREPPSGKASPAVTLLKPLFGEEAELYANLASFCRQDYDGPIQLVFGVTNRLDPAVAVVERLQAEFPRLEFDIVVDGRIGCSNPKVANLINMSARIRHDIVVLTDSDIRVGPDYLRRVVDAVEQAGQGAVTGLYYGIPAGGLWSQLSQLNIDGHFLPGVMTSVQFGLAKPCLGSTIAMRRDALVAAGGFEAVADCLADDHALGEAMRARGERITVLPFAVGHICNEGSFGELWRHELRWARTIRGVDPTGYGGWVINHAFPLALLSAMLGGGLPALALAFGALGLRYAMLAAIEIRYGLPRHPYWLVPFRDLLSFAVYLAGFMTRDVDWKGQRYRLMSEGTLLSDGTLVSERRSPSP